MVSAQEPHEFQDGKFDSSTLDSKHNTLNNLVGGFITIMVGCQLLNEFTNPFIYKTKKEKYKGLSREEIVMEELEGIEWDPL